MSALNAPQFQDEIKARRYLEKLRWADGRFCPHCGDIGNSGALEGEKHRDGLYKCYACREQFTVTLGTVFESSHIPLHKWLLAAYLMCTSKKGISSMQLQRMLQLKSYKSAWFLSHRLRFAMAQPDSAPMGANGGIVEADETYIGRKPGRRKARAGAGHKNVVFSLIERGGKVKSVHITGKTFPGIKKALMGSVSKDAVLMTDDARMYKKIGRPFADHQSVNHSAHEYVRGEAHTNTIENFFSVFKRGMIGTYQHCGSQHLHRYLAEFDFRHNSRSALGVEDAERTMRALLGIEGKRLTYKAPIKKAE
jgi:transposase-like protein